MTDPVRALFASTLLRVYPREWRDRYGDELLQLVEDSRAGLGGLVDVGIGGIRQRARLARGGGSMAPRVHTGAAFVAALTSLLVAAPTATFMALNIAGRPVDWPGWLTTVLPALPLVGLAVAIAPGVQVAARREQSEVGTIYVRVRAAPWWLVAVATACAILVIGVLAFGISDAILGG